MKFESTWSNTVITLKPCPFCGSDDLEVLHTGNMVSKKRSVEIKCKKCRIHRADWAIRSGFKWLEERAFDAWNRRS